MNCECRSSSTCAGHLEEAELTLQPTRFGGQVGGAPDWRFEDALIALRELDRDDLADRLEVEGASFGDALVVLEGAGLGIVADRLRVRWEESG